MKLFIDIKRTYHKDWTTGEISISSVVLSYSIELPWKENQKNISCIPEGVYEMQVRKSKKFNTHIWVKNVKNRKWILLHPANDARKELRGCIAPVMKLGNNGTGMHSRLALNILLLNISRNSEKQILLRITS